MLVNTKQEGNEKRKEKNASSFFNLVWKGKRNRKKNILYIYLFINHNM